AGVLARHRHRHLLHELARLTVLPAVGDEIVFKPYGAPALTFAQGKRAAQRDQRRRRVADGRAVGDVAADGAHVAHLLAADALDQVPKRRYLPRKRRQRLAVGDAGADLDPAGAHLDAGEAGEIADEDDRGNIA